MEGWEEDEGRAVKGVEGLGVNERKNESGGGSRKEIQVERETVSRERERERDTDGMIKHQNGEKTSLIQQNPSLPEAVVRS